MLTVSPFQSLRIGASEDPAILLKNFQIRKLNEEVARFNAQSHETGFIARRVDLTIQLRVVEAAAYRHFQTAHGHTEPEITREIENLNSGASDVDLRAYESAWNDQYRICAEMTPASERFRQLPWGFYPDVYFNAGATPLKSTYGILFNIGIASLDHWAPAMNGVGFRDAYKLSDKEVDLLVRG
jgi:hypothetical protein